MSRSRTARRAAGRRRDHGVNQILDDALGAFIDVLDQHTLADMAAAQPAPAPRRKPAAAARRDHGQLAQRRASTTAAAR